MILEAKLLSYIYTLNSCPRAAVLISESDNQGDQGSC